MYPKICVNSKTGKIEQDISGAGKPGTGIPALVAS